jgi:membrane protein YdbS with pleckstrin-like domain
MSSPSLGSGLDPGSRYFVPSERIAVNQRLHWSVIVPSFTAALLGLLAAGYLSGQLPNRRGYLDDAIWLAALALIANFVYRLSEWNVDRFVVTDRRIMMVTGLVTKKVAMMPLTRVTDMSYQRSLPGRIFGWGTFVLESAGQDQALRTIDRLPSPDELYAMVCGMMFGEDPGRSTGERGGSELDESGPDA